MEHVKNDLQIMFNTVYIYWNQGCFSAIELMFFSLNTPQHTDWITF